MTRRIEEIEKQRHVLEARIKEKVLFWLNVGFSVFQQVQNSSAGLLSYFVDLLVAFIPFLTHLYQGFQGPNHHFWRVATL